MDSSLVEAMQFYEGAPVEFCRDLVGVDLDEWQKDAFQALVDDHFVAIRAGSGVGKTVWMSLATMWFLGTKPFSKVPTTAPSQHQLQDLLWAEHHKNISRSDFLANLMIWTQTRVAVKKYEPQWYAVARTARVSPDGKVAEGLQGFHAEENLLYLVDEASGVPDEIFPAIEGALTGKQAYAILAANPTRLSGYFYAVFNDPRMRGLYTLLHVSCEDSRFVEERYLKMMTARYGRDHPIFQIKVLGDFPSADIELLFPPADVEKMKYNEMTVEVRQANKNKPIEIGVDVGRSTNRSTMCIRQGFRILEYQDKFLSGGIVDTIDTAQWILTAITAFEPTSVKIDANGIGAGVYDHLARIYPKIVRPVIGQSSPADEMKSRYTNLRAQGYWELRELLPYLYCTSWPDRLFDEMSDIKYKLMNGKIQVEAKDDIIRRNGASPDYTDATVYAFLDSKLCVDKHNPIVIPLFLGHVNDAFRKENPLLNLGKRRSVSHSNPRSGRFGALYG